jgi:hypothetical protein
VQRGSHGDGVQPVALGDHHQPGATHLVAALHG